MILYNVTIKLTREIHASWIEWMKEEHMPEMLATGCFTKYNLLRLLEVDEEEGPTYAAQYYAESKALYNQYIEQYSTAQRQKGIDKWGNQFIAFRTVMQAVD
ncbi:MAG: DUF4286 family protein [Chitinophagaceae bacterium]|nr:DUF4286 family protein [Chitinophagaceae bacterium]